MALRANPLSFSSVMMQDRHTYIAEGGEEGKEMRSEFRMQSDVCTVPALILSGRGVSGLMENWGAEDMGNGITCLCTGCRCGMVYCGNAARIGEDCRAEKNDGSGSKYVAPGIV